MPSLALPLSWRSLSELRSSLLLLPLLRLKGALIMAANLSVRPWNASDTLPLA
jgi:hypothetical protein